MTSLLDSLPLGFTLSDNEISLKKKKKKILGAVWNAWLGL